jgi:hypothetical protein
VYVFDLVDGCRNSKYFFFTWVLVNCHPVVERGVKNVVVIVCVGIDRGGAVFGSGRGFGVESGRGLGPRGTGLPFDDGVPVL